MIKKVIIIAVFLLIIVGIVGSIQKPQPNQIGKQPPSSATKYKGPPLAVTYFFYWYDLPNGVHSAQLTHRPREDNASYKNVDWFKKELSDMEYVGIDIALAVFWADEEPSSYIGLENMAKARDELLKEGKNPPKIALFVDTGFIGRWDVDRRDFTKKGNQQRLYQFIKRAYTILGDEHWALIDGRPVIWFWSAWFDIAFDKSFFDHLIGQFTSDFGTRPYLAAEASWQFALKPKLWGGVEKDTTDQSPLDAYFEWGAAGREFSDRGKEIAQVGPGYDERILTGPGREGKYVDRENGKFYQRSLEAAIASEKRILAIETWNEFHEGTDIADSKELGRQYLEITKRYIEKFKATTKE